MKQQGFSLRFSVRAGEGSVIGDFLSAQLVEAHVQQLPLLFDAGCICIDGEIVGPEALAVQGSVVGLRLPEHWEESVDTRWRLLWQNAELLAVYKPHLLPVSRTTRNLYNTLISLVRRETAFSDARLLHRLDTETAGVVLLAKNKQADQKWKPRLDQLMKKKIYHAWVSGTAAWQDKVYECELSEKTGSLIRSQMYVVSANEPDLYPKPRYCKTAFSVLKLEPGRSLIRCELFTGRKHQIRAQLASLGLPVIGDKLYSHDGYYYLKRIEQGLNTDDYVHLGAEHHLLEAVRCVISPEGKEIVISSD
ncbi:pseudouridine synthase [Amphritea balenae]|uniref:RluA family pseudouridine synthase n=1 Tax=Amphritea balenae TaxID=452629 RepID=A0A3P1STZ5_9GAMM|nr:pseudouridine synthase [Amphritea balenae]RRD00679.1 RluA family pseudouridine synthase [Amphritea balenae]